MPVQIATELLVQMPLAFDTSHSSINELFFFVGNEADLVHIEAMFWELLRHNNIVIAR